MRHHGRSRTVSANARLPVFRLDRLAALAGLSAALAGIAAPVAAQDESESGPVGPSTTGYTPPSIRAHRLGPGTGTIQLDGALTESVWADAPAATGLRQREPMAGETATERTEVRVLFDHQAMYVGVMAYDGDPERIISRTLARDRLMSGGFGLSFQGDDGVALLFDPFHDHRNAVVFATNPSGAKFEALITDEGREINDDWRGIWRVAARRTSEGWSAEFEIPFRTLRYPSGVGEEPWGFNLLRTIRRKNEDVLWSSWSRNNEGFQRVSRAGHLEGLADLPRPGLNLEVKPYLLSGATRQPVEADASPLVHETDPQLDAGLDIKYELTPGLVLDLTANPDFAQVEVDDEQVNLTRFSLFFPEKRDFFLENAGIFEFGRRGFGGPPDFLLFFSRRIGISNGEEVPLLGGARLTGRAGAQTIGFLDAVTSASGDQAATNYAALRVKRDVGSRGVIGAMLTDLRRSGTWNTAGGVDFSFWPIASVNLRGFVAGTATGGEGGDDYAYNLNLDHTGDHIGYFLDHLFVGPDANADLGFIRRTDIRRTNGHLRLTPRPRVLDLRKIDFRFDGVHQVRNDGLLQDWSASVSGQPEWNSGDEVRLETGAGFTRLDEGFELSDEVFVPAGDYDTWEVSGSLETSANRPVELEFGGAIEGFFGGTLKSLRGSVGINGGRHVDFSLGYRRNVVDIPFGEFTADVVSVRAEYSFSTTLNLNALVQYNSLDDRLSANVRLNLIHRPGSDLFLVLNEERGSEDSVWDFRSRGLVAKLTYLLRI